MTLYSVLAVFALLALLFVVYISRPNDVEEKQQTLVLPPPLPKGNSFESESIDLIISRNKEDDILSNGKLEIKVLKNRKPSKVNLNYEFDFSENLEIFPISKEHKEKFSNSFDVPKSSTYSSNHPSHPNYNSQSSHNSSSYATSDSSSNCNSDSGSYDSGSSSSSSGCD